MGFAGLRPSLKLQEQASVEARSTDAQGKLFEPGSLVIPSSFSI
jgi:hypothetical protein